MKRKHTPMILALQAQPMRGCHVSIPWINDVINPRERERLGQSETTTHASHGSYGPPKHLNRLHMCIPGTNLRAHQLTTKRKHKLRRPTWGSADPGIGRTDLWSADPGPPRGARSLVLEAISGVSRST
jgi:hypothetical protein